MVALQPGRAAWVGEAIFGAFDGLMTSLAVVLGAAHTPHRVILQVAVTVSLEGALAMGAGTLLEDNAHGWRECLAMAAATAAATFLLAVPVLVWPLHVAYMVMGALALGVAGAIAAGRGGSRRDWLVTYGVLALVALPTIAVTVAFGSANG